MPHFDEDWFSDWSCEVLAGLVGKVEDVPGMIVEIGSWQGKSTIALANAAFPRHVHAVDTWAGSPGEISAELASQRDVFATFQANIDEATNGNVEVHRMGWREFVPMIESNVALCFIDAEHTYKEVRDNIFAVLPKMARGGIICGDDQHHPPIRQALSEIFDPEWVWVSASVWWWVKP